MNQVMATVPEVDDDFATWVAARRPALLRAARAITGDPHLAEDVLHAALVSVMPRWGSLRDRRAADAYIRRAMVNHHYSWHRLPQHRLEDPVAVLPERAAVATGSGESVAAADQGRRLWELVLALPRQQRAAVVLRYYEGLSEAETARALGIGVGAVKSNTSRGVANLRRRAALVGLDGVG
ncbi:SigE family RNA polymerase sigma factor [Nocardioides sp.]|uniref:SigE family RNA polymerase sigma factor n=1 Tax=Nocardioides sp. TaxID=35761 RepID=UPI002ED308EA